MNKIDQAAIDACYEQALKSYHEGGLPIGSALTRGDEIIAVGHNRRVQQGNPILHGEMDCLQNAGRQTSYRDCTLYTSLSPCMMCSGTIVQFKIPRVVIGENRNFGGNEQFLRDHGVDVEIINDPRCIDLMARFLSENSALWAEDIAH
ncbi:MAG: nucleoside deaminase [Novosphingobium sp.]